MHRIDNPTAASSMPAPKAPGPPGFFTAGTPGGAAPTIVEYDWMNSIQEEIAYVCEQNGVVLSKSNNGQLLQAIRAILTSGTRRRLTAATTFYISTTGNDANNGATPATAFRSLQAAWSYLVGNIDANGQQITLQLADGVYTGNTFIWGAIEGQGANSIFIIGNVSNPGNVVLNCVTANYCLYLAWGALVNVQGVRIQNSGPPASNTVGSGAGLVCSTGAYCTIDHVDFGNCTEAQMYAWGSSLLANGVGRPYSISGGGRYHILADTNSTIVMAQSAVSFLGTPNFSGAFIGAYGCSIVEAWSMTFAGGCTGTRWTASLNGTISVTGANPDTYFPGTINGALSAGGIVA